MCIPTSANPAHTHDGCKTFLVWLLVAVKRLNDECRLKAIKEKAEAKGAKDARRASELNRRQAESGALVEALSVIRTLVDGRAEKPTKEITLEPDSQSEPDEGSDIADST